MNFYKIRKLYKFLLSLLSFSFYSNKIILQKKFYIYNVKLINNRVILCSRSKKELDDIDWGKELSPININEDYLLDNLKYFMNFEGYAMVFTFKVETKLNQVKDVYGIVFFNLLDYNIYDVRFFRLFNQSDINIIVLILNKWLKAGEFEMIGNWINLFLQKVDQLNDEINSKEKKFKTFKMYIDLEKNFRFIPLLEYHQMINFIKNIKITKL